MLDRPARPSVEILETSDNDLSTMAFEKKVEFRDSEGGINTCWGSSYDRSDFSAQNYGTPSPGDWKAQLSELQRKSFGTTLEGLPGVNEQSNLDSRAVLKAFRLIGSVHGIQIEELRQRIDNVRAEHIRKPLLKILDDIFKEFDSDENGYLDVIEFEALVNSSTILQEAVYDILASVNQEEAALNRAREVPLQVECYELASISIVLLNLLSIAISCDNAPDWYGWVVTEAVFAVLFTVDIGGRFLRSTATSRFPHHSDFKLFFNKGFSLKPSPTASSVFSSSHSHRKTARRRRSCIGSLLIRFQVFLESPTNILDLFATICEWIHVCILVADKDSTLSSDSFFWVVQQVRWVKFMRVLRLVHFMTYFRECGILLIGIITGIQSVMWGLTLNALIVLVWAITIRQHLESQKDTDGAAILREMFPSMPRSMHLIFRCMVLRADGFCVHTQHGHMLDVLSSQLGWLFDVMWISSEFFLLFVVFNVITATFCMQAAENAKKLQENLHNSLWQKDEVRLQSLDKLLRTLIYPSRNQMSREQSNSKDRYAAQVSRMIQKEHPDAAARIPNLEREVVNFARCIQESKSLLQNAYNRYEAKEHNACRNLQNIPSAKTYLQAGQEELMVDKHDASISNALGIPTASMSAVEVTLTQEQDNFNELLKEAEEVQAYVKSKICPHSTWAMTPAAGMSGDIRKHSNRLCDEAMDPGVKEVTRIEQKVSMKYGGRYECCRDYCRLGLIYNSVTHLMEALPLFLKFRLDSEGFQVASIENRFAHPHPLGWRDITILLKVVVPTSHHYHIMEVQLMLRGLTECRNDSHHFYEEIRGLLPQDVVMTILDRLVTDTTLDLGITHSEWLQCLHNKEVKQLLDELGVPSNCRKRLFDIVDIDDSGTVASSELQEMLRLFRTPAQALELAGCHFRVREVQRNVQAKLGPQLTKLHKHVISIGTALQEIAGGLAEFLHPELSPSSRRRSTPLFFSSKERGEREDLSDVLNSWMEDMFKQLQEKLAGADERFGKKSVQTRGDLAKRTLVSLPKNYQRMTQHAKDTSFETVT